MAVGIPSLFPDSFPADESARPEQKATNISSHDIRLTQEEVEALREFFLLLDKWDRQKKAA